MAKLKIEKDIAAMIEQEVRRRVDAVLEQMWPTVIEPKKVELPDWVNDWKLSVVSTGDAGLASRGDFFKLMVNERRDHAFVFCPTFLRGSLSISADRIGGIGY